MSIGVFDSGVGGLTVMREILRHLPNLSVTYFGDTARLPYGEKSRNTIIRFSRESVSFLMSQGVELVVIACHTASAMALDSLRQEFTLPLFGVVEPSIAKAVALTRNRRIAILGTRGTIASGLYQTALRQQLPDAHLIPIACPLFVPLVEEHLQQHPATRLIARDYLQAVKREGADTVVLACTHYPLLAAVIQDELGPDVTLVDAALACAEQVKQLYRDRPQEPAKGPHRFFVSDDPERFRRFGEQFLGGSIGDVGLYVTNGESDK